MTKTIAIGNCGNNILEFLKKQNYQIKRDENYEFISVANNDDIQQLQLNDENTIFVVSGLGGSRGGKLTVELAQTLLEKNLKVKNIVILPFNAETNANKAILELESLIAINQNVEVYPNNDFMEDESNTMYEIMGLADKVIFDRINRKNKITWKNFIIEDRDDKTNYKALVSFWSKDLKVTLLEPEFKIIDTTHMAFMTPSRFDFKDGDKEIRSIQDVESIAQNILRNYKKEVN